METKPRYRSKTYGFGAALLVLAAAVFGLPEVRAVVETLPADYQAAALLVIGVLTMVFRELTKGPVGAGPAGGEAEEQEGDANG